MSERYLVAGLGNPGRRYKKTRHNFGFMVIDHITSSLSEKTFKRIHQADVLETTLAGFNVILVKPMTYMNLSGEAIADIASAYRISSENLLVIYDDSALEFGQLRVRGKGSSGGHNGLESIIQELGTEKFPRLRIGIGSEKAKKNRVKFVLSKFDRKERKQLSDILGNAQEAIKSFMTNGLEKTMNEFNTRQKAKPNQEVST